MTPEEVLELARSVATQTVDYDLLGNPMTDADAMLWSAYGPLVVRLVNAAIAANEAKLIAGVGEPYTCICRNMDFDSDAYTASQVAAAVAKAKHESDEPPVMPNDDAICDALISCSDIDGIAYDPMSFERGYKQGQYDEKMAQGPSDFEGWERDKLLDRITEFEATLAKLQAQEPVAYRKDGKLFHQNTGWKDNTGFEPLYAAPVQAQEPLKDHEVAALVNRLRDIAVEFREAQQLRERIAQEIRPVFTKTPAQAPLTHDDIRKAGGIVHSDGNIFFTSIDKLNAAIGTGDRP